MFEAVKDYYRKLVPSLTDTELNDLQHCFYIQKFQKGCFIVRAWQICRFVSFINSGLVRFFYTVDGRDISIGFAGRGEYVSEYESFLQQTAAAQHIEALTDVEVVNLGFDDMQLLYKQHPALQEFGRKIAEHLFVILNQRTTALMVLTPEERYRQMIAANSALLQQVPQYMLASFIGVTPEHLSRIRKKKALASFFLTFINGNYETGADI